MLSNVIGNFKVGALIAGRNKFTRLSILAISCVNNVDGFYAVIECFKPALSDFLMHDSMRFVPRMTAVHIPMFKL